MTLVLESPFGQSAQEPRLLKYEQAKCMTDQEVTVWANMAREGLQSSGVCLPVAVANDLDLVTQLEVCCEDETRDFEVVVGVIDTDPASFHGAPQVVPVIEFKGYLNKLYTL